MSAPARFNQAQVDHILAANWARPRDPVSDAYKAGCKAIVELRLLGQPFKFPYLLGTAEADAWHAGTLEGHRLAREALSAEAA